MNMHQNETCFDGPCGGQGPVLSIRRLLLCLFILCAGSPGASGAQPDDRVEHLEQLVEQQRKQLLDQQDQISRQLQLIESIQAQLQALQKEKETAPRVVLDDPEPPATPTTVKAGKPAVAEPEKAPGVPDLKTMSNSELVKLWQKDRIPLDEFQTDVAADRGFFLVSNDQSYLLRVYGSARMLATYDSKQAFSPFDLDFPVVPTGPRDVSNSNYNWTMNQTRFGIDFLYGDFLAFKSEFDFKGRNEKFRIRHMFMRSESWLFGQHWSSFNSVPFLPLIADGHGTGGGAGTRPVQIKYMQQRGHLTYKISLEDNKPKLFAADSFDADVDNPIPNLAGNVDYKRDWGQLRIAAEVSPNRVKFDGGTSSDLGWGLILAGKYRLNDSTTLMANIMGLSGTLGTTVDWTYVPNDMVYNPSKGEFQNIKVWGGQVSLMHYWNADFISTAAFSYMDVDTRAFQGPLTVTEGNKALVNLFYRPSSGRLQGLTVGAEIERAARTNINRSKNDLTRFSVLAYFDF
ncbi:MAG: DcaP family trimeric outer membrane transporter [Desulfuromonadales bacterium]|nr:DcaP family trimeric outer membrane transporter [Desulfuromonadales bacterium]